MRYPQIAFTAPEEIGLLIREIAAAEDITFSQMMRRICNKAIAEFQKDKAAKAVNDS